MTTDFTGEDMYSKILVTGATGQIGSELVPELRKKYGDQNVIAVGNKTMPSREFIEAGPFEMIDARDMEALRSLVNKYEIDTIYHLVGILSATGEKNPALTWDVNMGSLKNVLDLAVEFKLKIFWPSSIAAFGPTTPKENTPQKTILEPSTMYGVTKASGELICNYYHLKYGVDVRSLRYPGIISWKTEPGGGTTDYAVAVFYEALQKGHYSFFVNEKTTLPMMYMDDAVRATIELMDAPPEKIKERTSYNVTAISFSAEELAKEVKKIIPNLSYDFKPDSRQNIADSWPKVIDDSAARRDWGWKHNYDLHKMSRVMIDKLKEKFSKGG